MLPLPWWILGTFPEESEDVTSDATETTESSFEAQDSIIEPEPTTPMSEFRTPLSSPLLEPSDAFPSVVDLPTFMKVAKRRSSTTLESMMTKIRRTSDSKKSSKSIERKETEVMKKGDDGWTFQDLDQTFRLLGSESPTPENPMDKTSESLADKSVLNTSDNLDESESEKREEEESSLESPTREYPMFFTSFNDTTVLFNTTINGDYDEKKQKSNNNNDEAVGDWIFKGNKLLEDTQKDKVTKEKGRGDVKEDDGEAVFKQPTNNNKVQKPKKSSTRKRASKKEQEPIEIDMETPSTSTSPPPMMTRRQTPSRKVKTYKSLREV